MFVFLRMRKYGIMVISFLILCFVTIFVVPNKNMCQNAFGSLFLTEGDALGYYYLTLSGSHLFCVRLLIIFVKQYNAETITNLLL